MLQINGKSRISLVRLQILTLGLCYSNLTASPGSWDKVNVISGSMWLCVFMKESKFYEGVGSRSDVNS